jgi:thiol-disulfide isomerase/thioredoxin
MKIILQFLVSLLVLSCSAKNSSSNEQPGQTAPAAAVTDSIPFPVYMTFDEFEPYIQFSNDTTYVINFWATWCKPCVAEMPYFEKLIREYAGEPVKVYMVSMDFPKDIQRKLIPFVQERNLAPHVLALADMDYNSWIDKVSTEWDGAIPFTLIYNKKGRQVKSGEMDGYEELESMVKNTMN